MIKEIIKIIHFSQEKVKYTCLPIIMFNHWLVNILVTLCLQIIKTIVQDVISNLTEAPQIWKYYMKIKFWQLTIIKRHNILMFQVHLMNFFSFHTLDFMLCWQKIKISFYSTMNWTCGSTLGKPGLAIVVSQAQVAGANWPSAAPLNHPPAAPEQSRFK